MPVKFLNRAVVVVTGAGSGIGRASARKFARSGARVVCVDINADTAAETAELCDREPGSGHPDVCDVADREAMVDLAGRVEADLGPVMVVMNNAGVGVYGDFDELSIDDWQWIRSINLDAVVYSSHIFGRPMVERGEGQVINVASGAAWVPDKALNLYSTTKAAVLTFSQALRADWAGTGVGVTAICPGVISTPIVGASRMSPQYDNVRVRGDRIMRQARRLRPPSRVADVALRAVKEDLDVVPVGVESHAARAGSYLLPRPVKEFVARRGIGEW